MWPFTLNVIDEHKGTVPDDQSVRYEPFVAKPERSPFVVRSLRGWGVRLVRLADRLETA